MANDFFAFRNFTVYQSRCAMKVGTDGVLLGTWAKGGKRILDIGSGTGLISLLMAQRYPDAKIQGIDIDAEAVAQSVENVNASPFKERISISLNDLNSLDATEFPDSHYDCIVSNPPFFENSMKCPDSQRSMARHTDTLSFTQLITAASRLLCEGGVFSLILPYDSIGKVTEESSHHALFPSRRCDIKPNERKAPKRSLIEFTKSATSPMQPCEHTTELLMEGNNKSQWYSRLTKGILLKD